MSRFIDADALIEIFKAEHDWSSVYIVEDMPSADVVEVVHGEWIMINEQLAKCSVCGGYESTNGKDKTGKGVIFKMQKKFCPHCGADMRGENNELHK